MANALDDVQQTYISLNDQYAMLLAACHPGTNERTELEQKYAQAQENYYACVNKTLSDDDAQVKTLSDQLQAANKQVAQATQQMGQMQKVIADISTAIGYGSGLLTLV